MSTDMPADHAADWQARALQAEAQLFAMHVTLVARDAGRDVSLSGWTTMPPWAAWPEEQDATYGWSHDIDLTTHMVLTGLDLDHSCEVPTIVVPHPGAGGPYCTKTVQAVVVQLGPNETGAVARELDTYRSTPETEGTGWEEAEAWGEA